MDGRKPGLRQAWALEDEKREGLVVVVVVVEIDAREEFRDCLNKGTRSRDNGK